MTEPMAMLIFLTFALLFALLACSARTAERLLWGSVLCSLGLGVAVQISGGSYYGIIMIAALLVTDLVVYLYFRTQNLLPARPPVNLRLDRLFRIFFLWLAACCVVGVSVVLFKADPGLPLRAAGSPGLAILHERIWATDWLLVLIPVVSLVGFVVGGFFLVRKER